MQGKGFSSGLTVWTIMQDVWLNGQFIGSHEGMFNPFEFDITDKVRLDGENILVVGITLPGQMLNIYLLRIRKTLCQRIIKNTRL